MKTFTRIRYNDFYFIWLSHIVCTPFTMLFENTFFGLFVQQIHTDIDTYYTENTDID
jgi:hypothetical protein